MHHIGATFFRVVLTATPSTKPSIYRKHERRGPASSEEHSCRTVVPERSSACKQVKRRKSKVMQRIGRSYLVHKKVVNTFEFCDQIFNFTKRFEGETDPHSHHFEANEGVVARSNTFSIECN